MLLAPNGTVQVTLLAGESIAVYSQGYTVVSRLVGFPNYPDKIAAVGTVNNSQAVFGPYASGAQIIIEAQGGVEVQYETGSSPVVKQDRREATLQVTPVAVNVTGTLTTANLLAGIITSTTAAAVTGTLPTGALLEAASDFAIDEGFDWVVINTGATNAFTIAAGTNHTIVGSATVALSSSGNFRTRKTAASTFVTYRIG
jgi:hypothetical protein